MRAQQTLCLSLTCFAASAGHLAQQTLSMNKTSLTWIRRVKCGMQVDHMCLEQQQRLDLMLSLPHLSSCSLAQIPQVLSLQA